LDPAGRFRFLLYVKGVLKDYQAQGGSVFRTVAYKYPMPPELRGMNALDCLFDVVLAPMQRALDELRPRAGDTLEAVHIRLCGCHGVGEFLIGQIIRYLKYAEPLRSASDWDTFVARGPGSERGLNLLYSRPITAKWSRPLFCAAIEKARQRLNPELIRHGIAPLDGQNTNNLFCETFKLHRAIERGGKPSRPYKPSGKPMPPPIPGFETSLDSMTTPSVTDVEPTDKTTVDNNAVPEHILEDQAGDAPEHKAKETGPKPPPPPPPPEDKPSKYPPQKRNGRGKRDYGQRVAFYIYEDARSRYYLGVARTTTKQFPQYHWDGKQWIEGLPDGFLKIPYRLPELLDAPVSDWVVIAAGEKDAETAVRLGFAATTNPGGEGKGQWTPELNKWFAGRKRIAIMEDNDKAGHAHAIEVANALRGIVPDIRIVPFRELKSGGDLTDWAEADPTHDHAALLTRIEAAPAGFSAPQRAPIREWASKPVPEQEFTVPDRIPAEQVFLFSGEGGGGKSEMAQHLDAAHVLGREWMGIVPRQGPAIHIECEDAMSVLHRRLAVVSSHYDVPIETFDRDLHLFSLTEHDSILATVSKNGVIKPTAVYQWLYELAGDLKPVQISIASVANIFAGSEIDRIQVQQFIKLLNRIPALTKGSLVLVSQPSLTGIASTNVSHEGLSGTTQWHNAVRGRAVVKHIRPKDGDNSIIDTGLRTITFHKNQYGPPVAGITVCWTNGMFLPVAGSTTIAGAERAAAVEGMALALLARFNAQNRQLSIVPNPNNYAAKEFAETPEAEAAGFTTKDFRAALDRLLGREEIENAKDPSSKGKRERYHLRIKPKGGPA
jgi:RecA-family ATPase